MKLEFHGQDGTIARRKSREAGEVRALRITALSDTLFVTAVSTASRNLLLIAWALLNNDEFDRHGDSGKQAGTVEDISLVRISPDSAGNHRVVTAVRDGAGKLLMITWSSISPDGRTIRRLSFDHDQAGSLHLTIRSCQPS